MSLWSHLKLHIRENFTNSLNLYLFTHKNTGQPDKIGLHP